MSDKKDKKAKKVKKAKNNYFGSVFSKYKILLISITTFLLLIGALLGLNLYSSLKIGQDTAQINASAYMRDLTQAITRDLFNLRLSYGEDPNTPHMSNTIGRLQQNIDLYQRNLNAMRDGGLLTDADGDAVEIDSTALQPSADELQSMEKEWAQLSPFIRAYLENARTVNASLTDLDLAVNQSQSSSNALAEEINTIASNIKRTAFDRADLLTYLQFFGILAIIVYFVIFIFFVLRQLMKSDEQAEAARQETNEILNTVNEGLFLVDESLEISSQHSQALNQLLGVEEISGKKLDTLLEQIVSRKDMEVAEEFIQQLFNPRVKAKLINDLNPLDRVRAGIPDKNGQIQMRYFKFSFSRVYDGDDIVRVLVSVADVTKTVMLEERLERERVQNDEQVEMLTAILKVDGRMINSFMRNAHRSAGNINNILRQPASSKNALREKARNIFREAHSLKGEASALGLQSFVGLAKELEDKVKPLSEKNDLVGDDFIPLAVSLEQMVTTLERVEGLVERIGGFGGEGTASGDNIAGGTSSENRGMASSYNQYFEQFIQQIADRNQKQVQVSAQGFEKAEITEEQSDIVKDLTIQLVRNAVVHGIESPDERQSKGKPSSGQIQIHLGNTDKGLFELIVEDDGRGIDYELIRNKVRRQRHLSEEQAADLTKKDLITAMFRSGFSTMRATTEDAGRGVGMDVIKDRLRELHGKVNILSENGRYTRFVIQFPKAG